jgi:hypothetical protein
MSLSGSGLRLRRSGQHTTHGTGRRLHRRLATTGSALAVAVAATLGTVQPAQAATPMYIGSVGGGYTQLQSSTGEDLANHAYSTFSSKVPTAAMITVHAGSASWRQVADVSPGSALHDQIVRWAQTIKSRPGRVMLAYNHEPEAAAGGQRGTAAEFIAAWRRVHTIFRQQGVTNVEWTWQMTAYSFRAPATDARAAAKWYPGDAYVDNIGADAYNWYTCGHGNGRWMELKALGDPVLAFARAHGKVASFPEFASTADSRRAEWVRNAHQYLLDNQDVLTAAFYFHRTPTNPANQDCRWPLTTSAEFDAFGDIARDSAHFTN